MKIAIITDTHFGLRNDNQEFQDYAISFYTDVLFPTLREQGIKTIWHGGDMFDRRKFINFLTLNKWGEKVLSPMNDEFETYCIPGNHDVYYKNSNHINSLNELLKGYKNFKIMHEPTEVEFGDKKVLFLPWLNGTNYQEYMETVRKSRANVMLGHLELKGFEMHKGMTSESGMSANDFNHFDLVLSGHYHTKSTKGNINYLGAPYEMTWNDYDDPRGFHILDTETLELTFIQNPCTMFHKVHYNDEEIDYTSEDVSYLKDKIVKLIVVKKNNLTTFDYFLDKLYDVNCMDLGILEDMNDILGGDISDDDAKDIEKDTVNILCDYVESLATSHNKSKIKDLMKELYVEASERE